MAKKTFKDTSAVAALFISDREPEPAAPAPAQIETPAPSPAQQIAGSITPPQGYRVNHEIIETKSKRVQLLMQPTLHSRLKEAAAAQGLSFNDFVHRALEAAVKEQE